MNTSEELGIFWASRDGHVEVSGIYVYGFWSRRPLPGDMMSLAELWKGVDAEIAVRAIPVNGDNYIALTVWVKTWPSAAVWRKSVEETLNAMINQGAVVSWCGGESCSWSLNELDPATSDGCVYAAASAATGILFHSELYEEISYLTDDELEQLRVG